MQGPVPCEDKEPAKTGEQQVLRLKAGDAY